MEYQYIQIEKNGSAQTLKANSGPFSDDVQEDEVIIDVKYSGINFADILMRLGVYRDAPAKPFIPGYEVSGVVARVGPKVERFKVGDRVMAGCRFGGYVSRIKLPEWQVLKLPSGFSLEEGAALPVNFITAYIALHEFGRVRRGDKVLIDAATGGVGVIFLQMCKEAGAEAVGLTTSVHKKEFISTFGAKAYTRNEFEQSGETNFDFILNSSGGKSLKDQYKLLSKSGKLCCIGLQSMVKNGKGNFFSMLKAAMSSPWFPILKLVMESKSVSGFNALKYFDDDVWMKKHLPFIEETQIKPHIGHVFPAKETAKAHATLEQKQAKGKVLISWAEV